MVTLNSHDQLNAFIFSLINKHNERLKMKCIWIGHFDFQKANKIRIAIQILLKDLYMHPKFRFGMKPYHF